MLISSLAKEIYVGCYLLFYVSVLLLMLASNSCLLLCSLGSIFHFYLVRCKSISCLLILVTNLWTWSLMVWLFWFVMLGIWFLFIVVYLMHEHCYLQHLLEEAIVMSLTCCNMVYILLYVTDLLSICRKVELINRQNILRNLNCLVKLQSKYIWIGEKIFHLYSVKTCDISARLIPWFTSFASYLRSF